MSKRKEKSNNRYNVIAFKNWKAPISVVSKMFESCKVIEKEIREDANIVNKEVAIELAKSMYMAIYVENKNTIFFVFKSFFKKVI